MLPVSLDLSGERDIQICANASKTSLRVKFLRESYPPLNDNPTMKFLVVEKEDGLPIRPNLPLKGCCLQLSDSIHLLGDELEQSGKLCASLNKFLSEHHKELRFTYDCPIRAQTPEDLLLLSEPGIPPVSTSCRYDEPHQVVGPWAITIESGMCFQSYTILGDRIFVPLDLFYTDRAYQISANIVKKQLVVALSPLITD